MSGALGGVGLAAGLLKYILRPPLASERLLPGPDGLVRIALKKPFSDGTVAVDLDPLSLLCRLVALVPAPRFHTVRYFGVLASASRWRPLIVPKPVPSEATDDAAAPCSRAPTAAPPSAGSRYRPWAELLRRTFAVDVETCPRCGGRMRLLAVIADPRTLPASSVTAESRPSHRLELHPVTRTSRPSSSSADTPASPPLSESCSKSTEHSRQPQPASPPVTCRSAEPRAETGSLHKFLPVTAACGEVMNAVQFGLTGPWELADDVDQVFVGVDPEQQAAIDEREVSRKTLAAARRAGEEEVAVKRKLRARR